MRKQIIVRATEIRQGHRESATHCPIALAIKRALNPTDVCVVDEDISIEFPDRYGHAPLPRKAVEFIKTFDKHGRRAVRPFSFRLEVPLSVG